MVEVNFRGRNPLNRNASRADEVAAYTSELSALLDEQECKAVDLVVDPRFRDLVLALFSSHPSFLVVKEPSVVVPLPCPTRCLSAIFESVVFLGRVPTESALVERWPQRFLDKDDLSKRLLGADRNGVVSIAANKFSAAAGELYSLRRMAFAQLDVDVYGTGWGNSRIQNFISYAHSLLLHALTLDRQKLSLRLPELKAVPSRIEITNKFEVIGRYKACLVIENSLDVMTEKLFDAWQAGAVPVYVGPKLTELGLPQELAVEAEPSIEGIRVGMEKALTMDREVYLAKLRTFLEDPAMRDEWSSLTVWKRIAECHSKAL